MGGIQPVVASVRIHSRPAAHSVRSLSNATTSAYASLLVPGNRRLACLNVSVHRSIATSASIAEYLPTYHAWRQKWLSPNSPMRQFPLESKINIGSALIDNSRKNYLSNDYAIISAQLFSRVHRTLPRRKTPRTCTSIDTSTNSHASRSIASERHDLADVVKSLPPCDHPSFNSAAVQAYHTVLARLRESNLQTSSHISLLSGVCSILVTKCFNARSPHIALAESLVSQFMQDIRDPTLNQSLLSATRAVSTLVREYARTGNLKGKSKLVQSLAVNDIDGCRRSVNSALLAGFLKQPNNISDEAGQVYSEWVAAARGDLTASDHSYALQIFLKNGGYQKYHHMINYALTSLIDIFKNSSPESHKQIKIDVSLALLNQTPFLEGVENIFSKICAWQILDIQKVQVGLLRCALRLAKKWQASYSVRLSEEMYKDSTIEETKLSIGLHWFRRINRFGAPLSEEAANVIVSQFAPAGLANCGVVWASKEMLMYGYKLSNATVIDLLAGIGRSMPNDVRSGSEHLSLAQLWDHCHLNRIEGSSLPFPVISAFVLAHCRIGDARGALCKLQLLPRSASCTNSTLLGETEAPTTLGRHYRNLLNNSVFFLCNHSSSNAMDIIQVWKSLRDLVGSKHTSLSALLQLLTSKGKLLKNTLPIVTLLVESTPQELGTSDTLQSILRRTIKLRQIGESRGRKLVPFDTLTESREKYSAPTWNCSRQEPTPNDPMLKRYSRVGKPGGFGVSLISLLAYSPKLPTYRRPDQPRPTAPPPPLSRQILAVNVANISNKRPAIRHIVRNTRIWAISETCITSSKFRFTVLGFDVIQHPATGPGRRGIALGIPSCFGGHEHGSAVGTMILAKVPNFTPECLWIVGSVYVGHSGATTNYNRREVFASIRQALDRVVPFDNNHPVLIFGDWNTDPQCLQRIVHLWGHGLTVMQFSGSQITRLSTVHGRRHSSIDHFVCNAPARALLTSPQKLLSDAALDGRRHAKKLDSYLLQLRP
ncbi:hypothetical protein BASA50_009012 [Batrachochytrium salamandrivorans]|uniref:Endonuclease/exonuclease/phosphatase domain-containing protein n=1 Tax=Batrachochytrium salamandrivorans TaxID=1357716 RepID=A0ABQ8F5S9_9FUNG|nr:hypothetical protein BASA50_009012 [Batrachochytrium salamandrivorans]KAH9277280.1 hypothetical protein BASA83_000147 [Batrachochytrium salamandrivorans]